MIAFANNSKFKDYVDKVCGEMWSNIRSLTTEEYQGRLHYKLTSQMLWYRTRYYVKLPLVELPKEQYAQSQFFASYPLKYDELEERGGVVVLSRYVLIESENHFSEEACNRKRLSYKPEHILSELKEQDPLFFTFVTLSYEDYQLKMVRWPPNKDPPFRLADVRASAQSSKLGANQCQVIQYLGDQNAKAINRRDLEGLLTKKGQVDSYIAHSHRWIVEFNSTVFVLEFLIVYYLKERYEEHSKERKNSTTEYKEYFYPEGKAFDGLFLLCSHERPNYMLGAESKFVRCSHPSRGPSQLLEDAFSRTLERSKNLYKSMTESDLEKLFSSFKIKNQRLEWVSEHCRIGDLFYLDRGAYDHVGVYLGGDLIIHVSVVTFSGVTNHNASPQSIQDQLSGKMFQFSSFDGFAGVEQKPDYQITVKRLWFFSFTKEEIVEEAIRMSERHIDYDVHSNNCEHLAVELVTGRNYSTQSGILSFLVKPIVHAGLYQVSW